MSLLNHLLKVSEIQPEPVTYYGPWVTALPDGTPSGSICEVEHSGRVTVAPVVGGRIYFRDARFDFVSFGYDIQLEDGARLRRVYPPGCVIPEPRPMMVDGELRDLSESKWWMIELLHAMPSWSLHDETSVKSMFGGHIGLLLLSTKRCYPVQLAGGVPVAIPWKTDMGVSPEEPRLRNKPRLLERLKARHQTAKDVISHYGKRGDEHTARYVRGVKAGLEVSIAEIEAEMKAERARQITPAGTSRPQYP